MTTIVSNGYYMIADKRTNFGSSAVKHPVLTSECKDFKFSRPSRRHFNDEVTKLVPEPKTMYGEKKVLAIAGSGNVETINDMLSCLEYMTIDQLVKLKSRSGQSRQYVQLLFITEDFHTHQISFTTVDQAAPTERTYQPGKIVAIGSGGVILMEFQDRLQVRLEKTHLLNLFLLGTNTDEHSSNCFDVYGAQEKKYFSNIMPSHEEVNARVTEAAQLLDFASYRKRHHFNPKNSV